MDFKQTLTQAIDICEKMAIALNKGGRTNPYCKKYCPTIDGLITVLKTLSAEAINVEPECALVLQAELARLKNPMNHCVNPYAFGVVKGILNVLKKNTLTRQMVLRRYLLVILLRINPLFLTLLIVFCVWE